MTMPTLRCAIYTRVSSDSGLEQDFNSLDAQRESAEAYIKSQAHEGWRLIRDRFDDGGSSGGSMERPALLNLLEKIRDRRIGREEGEAVERVRYRIGRRRIAPYPRSTPLLTEPQRRQAVRIFTARR